MDIIRKKSVKWLLIGIVFFSTGIIFNPIVDAAKQEAIKSGVDFQIGAVQSRYQVDKKNTYFDLKLQPGQQETLQIEVQNTTDRTIHVSTYATTATTSDAGAVVYSKSAAVPDKTQKFKIENFVKTKTPSLTLQPKQTQVVSYNVKMPKENFDGLLCGGITFIEDIKDTQQKSSGSMGIKNQYAYSKALVFHGKTENAKGNLVLSSVTIGQMNLRNIFKVTLRNPESAFLNRLSIHSRVIREDTKKLLFEDKKEMLQVAPNSIFNLPISLNGKEFQPGKYILFLEGKSNGRIWNLKKEFSIDEKKAKNLNKKDITIKTDYSIGYIVIGCLLIILVGIIVIFMLKKNRKYKKEVEKLKEQLTEKD